MELSGCTVTFDLGAEASKRLIDGVVDDLPDQMVQACGARGADIHARTLTDRLKAFEDLDAARAVFFFLGHAHPLFEMHVYRLLYGMTCRAE
jgi:hypothetical protein